MIATTVDIVMTEETSLPTEKLVTDVVGRTTLLKNVSKMIVIQSHTTGPEVRVTVTDANLVVNLRKSSTQSRLILMIVKVAVVATKWRI